MTTERIIEHLRRMHYSPRDKMNLEADRQTLEREQDALADLYARGLTLKEITQRRHRT